MFDLDEAYRTPVQSRDVTLPGRFGQQGKPNKSHDGPGEQQKKRRRRRLQDMWPIKSEQLPPSKILYSKWPKSRLFGARVKPCDTSKESSPVLLCQILPDYSYFVLGIDRLALLSWMYTWMMMDLYVARTCFAKSDHNGLWQRERHRRGLCQQDDTKKDSRTRLSLACLAHGCANLPAWHLYCHFDIQ